MKRPIGVKLCAIVLGLFAALNLLLSAFSLLIGVFSRNARLSPTTTAQAPPISPNLIFGIIIAFSVFLAMLAAWAILTLIGVLRLRAWARYSILVIGGFLVFIAVCSIFGLALAASVVPAQPNIPVSTMHGILLVQGLFYSAVAAVGAWWLVFFNFKTTKAYFLPSYAQPDPSAPALRRPPGHFAHVPTSILVLAGLIGCSAVCCAVMACFTMPTFLFGFTFTGPSVHFIYLGYALLMGFISWGLVHLDNRARLALYALTAYSALNFAVMLTPWGRVRYTAYQRLLHSSFGLTSASTPQLINPASTPVLIAVVLLCLIFYAVQIWILEHNRRAFTSAPPPREF